MTRPIVCLWICACAAGFLFPPAARGFDFDTVAIERIDTHGAVILWQTDAAANGNIYYGQTFAAANQAMLVLESSRTHRTSLFGLLEGEDYVFRIDARDASGERKVSKWYSFRTLGVPLPKILKADLVQPLKDGGKVVWQANIPVRGMFECGYDTKYGYVTEEKKFNAAHEVTVKRFTPNRRIHYRIRAVDARGLKAPEYRGEFMTAEDNIAYLASCTGTFIYNPEPKYIPDSPPIITRLTDGALNYFYSMGTSGDPDGDTQWILVDLGKLQFVGQILTYWRMLAYPKKFSLMGSVNGEKWIEFGDTFNAGTGSSARSSTGDPVWIHQADVGNMILRYIKLVVPKGAPYHRKFDNYRFVQMFEFKVYPPEIKQP